MGIKSIVLITTGQPSVNPRIVKEANALQATNYKVTVLYCFWIPWAMASDKELFKNVKWNYQLIGGDPVSKKWRYLFTKVRARINKILNKFIGNKLLVAERTQARCYDELLHVAKAIKADWYIGHNLGALPVAVKAAKFNKAKCGFDFEDYHREETDNFPPADLKRIIYLEDKYVPLLQYISTASTLITEKIQQNFPLFSKQIVTVFNCFPLSQQPVFKNKSADDNTLHFFWFSQTIGKNRGLEPLLKAMEALNDKNLHLTLAGRCNAEFEQYVKGFETLKNNIHFAGIIQPDLLPDFAANFDVGLAIELAIPPNRNICLTNKIFTYLLAGNAMLISDTLMQTAFNELYKVGELFSNNNIEELKQKVNFYKDKDKLNTQKRYNYDLARTSVNWENESKKLLEII